MCLMNAAEKNSRALIIDRLTWWWSWKSIWVISRNRKRRTRSEFAIEANIRRFDDTETYVRRICVTESHLARSHLSRGCNIRRVASSRARELTLIRLYSRIRRASWRDSFLALIWRESLRARETFRGSDYEFSLTRTGRVSYAKTSRSLARSISGRTRGAGSKRGNLTSTRRSP